MEALRINCKGKVQGVFFRGSTKNMADELGVKGWVKNEPDGSVSIHAEGDSEGLKGLMDWCKQGSKFAQVLSVESIEVGIEGFSSFEIRHS